MIEIVPLSPENELPAAERLAQLIRAEWPDLASAPAPDSVRIFVGVGMQFEVDLLVEISLAHDRPVAGCRMRDGRPAPARSIACGVLAIEVKQQSREGFLIAGTDVFPSYGRTTAKRSVGKQVNDGVIAVRDFLRRYGAEKVFVHGLGWLTDMPEAELRAAPHYIVGRETTWSTMLQAAATRQPILFDEPPPAYRRSIEDLGRLLTRRRRPAPRDRHAVDRLTNSVIAGGKFDDVKNALGARQVRIAGRAGSGKSTTLALLADYVARVRQERLLVLAYHHALCHEIERLIRSVVDDDAMVDRHVRVTTLVDFLGRACADLGADIPAIDGRIDYLRVDGAFRELLASKPVETLRDDVEILKELDPDRYGFEYVCVDEAQDCLDSERDLLRILYPAERLVLADGMDQLVRRPISCDWTTGLKPAQRLHVELSQSLRMSHNVAAFATAMADAMGVWGWRITPHRHLTGGRVIVAPNGYDRSLFAELVASMDDARVARKDMLVCVPPSEALTIGARRDSRAGEALREWGYDVWNGCDQEIRRSEIAQPDEIRIVQYASMRGLEGWYTVLIALDDFYVHRVTHSNDDGDRRSPEDVAKRWLLMALTRAAHTLVVTVSDPASDAAVWLRRATETLKDVPVEWRS